MADNYLEKQREAYEARKAAWLKAKKFGKKSVTGHKQRPNALSNNLTKRIKINPKTTTNRKYCPDIRGRKE